MADQELILRIRGDLRDIQTKLRRLERDGRDTADGIGDRFERAGRRMRAAFTAARGPLLALGAAAGGLALLSTRSLAATEALQDMADRASVSAEFLQEMRFAANQSGASARDFDDAISRLNRRLGLFIQSGGGPAAQAFERLGLNTRIASGELRDSESVFNASVEALQNVASEAERSAIASQLFGEDSGPRLAALVGQGAAAISGMRQEARDLGVVLENDLVRNAAAASDALEKLQQQTSAARNRAIAENTDGVLALGRAWAFVERSAIGAAAAIAQALEESGRRGPAGMQAFVDGLDQSQAAMREFRDWWNSQTGEMETIRVPATVRGRSRGAGGGGAAREAAEPLPPPISVGSRLRGGQLMPSDSGIAGGSLEELLEASKEAGETLAKSAGEMIAPEFERNQDAISNSLENGIRAAFNGDLLDFIGNNLRNAAFSALADAITSAFSSKGGGLFSTVVGAIFGGSIGGPGKATGGPASGLTLVGEQGPELVNLGGMANVMTANMTRMAMAGGRSSSGAASVKVNSPLYIDARGATPDAVARLRAELPVALERRDQRLISQLRAEVPGLVVRAQKDGVLR